MPSDLLLEIYGQIIGTSKKKTEQKPQGKTKRKRKELFV